MTRQTAAAHNSEQIRKRKMKPACIALITALISLTSACSTPDRSRNIGDPAVSGRTIAIQVCANCHGVNGNSTSPNFPKLAGQQETYFIAQLNEFKSHGRIDPAGFEYMWGLSSRLNDKQIAELAKYYAEQKPFPDEAGDPARANQGKRIFTSGITDKGVPACASCHGAEANGNATFPRLAGQHADYIVKQLKIFQRTNERPAGAIMKGVTHDLSDSDMTAVAAYVQALASD